MTEDDIQEWRITETKQQMEQPEIKELLEKNKDYVEEVKAYSFEKLMQELQPRWTAQRELDEAESTKLVILLFEYGFDMEYFKSGAGSCCIS